MNFFRILHISHKNEGNTKMNYYACLETVLFILLGTKVSGPFMLACVYLVDSFIWQDDSERNGEIKNTCC